MQRAQRHLERNQHNLGRAAVNDVLPVHFHAVIFMVFIASGTETLWMMC